MPARSIRVCAVISRLAVRANCGPPPCWTTASVRLSCPCANRTYGLVPGTGGVPGACSWPSMLSGAFGFRAAAALLHSVRSLPLSFAQGLADLLNRVVGGVPGSFSGSSTSTRFGGLASLALLKQSVRAGPVRPAHGAGGFGLKGDVGGVPGACSGASTSTGDRRAFEAEEAACLTQSSRACPVRLAHGSAGAAATGAMKFITTTNRTARKIMSLIAVSHRFVPQTPIRRRSRTRLAARCRHPTAARLARRFDPFACTLRTAC